MHRILSPLLALTILLASAAGIPVRVQARPLCQTAPPRSTDSPAPTYGYKVVQSFPHDAQAFTQGLVYDNGILFESTGLNGRSSLRRVSLEDGVVLQKRDVPSEHFAEGIALVDDRIIQLTWLTHKAFVYDAGTFDLLDEFAYPTEGWGLTYDGERLIMSDGTDNLYFRDPDTFTLLGSVKVRDGGQPVVRLNELEYIEGEVYANIWQTDRITRIDPASGQVVGWIDLTGLLPPEDRARANVLNGIAYDAETDRLFVTGKLWPKLFEIRLVRPNHNLFCPSILTQNKTPPALANGV
ncbi:MAG: glutaminyl-peptide cyclotransferase [Caldilineales bacterium]|nr:glutaminyl-peptide cyclotransferase [Caldilineales bacterium]